MTTTDAILNSNFLGLTPLGLINGFGGKKANTYTRNNELDAKSASGFGGGQGPFGNGGYYSYTSSGFDDFGDLGDIFSSFFGGGSGFGGRASARNNNGPIKGADLKASIDISFEDSFLGVEKELVLNRDEECPVCHGSKAKPGTKPETCSVCKGTGTIRQIQTTILRTNANSKNMY